MIGSLTKCIAEFLRNTEIVKNNNIPVYTANTVEGRFTVNTSLPAILITVAPSEDPTVFISGNILDSIIIHIRYMDDLLNYTMSEDDGIYEDRRDWAYQLRDELWNNKQSTYFKQFMNVNGLNIMYKGMSTYTHVGVLENLSKDIDVFSFIFSCNLFSDQLSSFPTVPLQEFFITLQGAHGERPDPGLVTVTASGEKFPVWNTVQGSDKIKSFSIHGKSYQNGNPTPLAPVEIQSVGDNSLLLQIGDSQESVNHTIDVKKAIQDAGHDGILRSVNGIYDEVVYNGKEWKLIQRIQNDRIITCTGVSNHADLGFCDCYFSLSKMSITGYNISSNYFVPGTSKIGIIQIVSTGGFGSFTLANNGGDFTLDDANQWLSNHELEVIYILRTPAEYPLDLPVITTYDNQTYFASNAAEVKPRMVAQCQVSKALDYIREGLIGYYTGRGRSNTDENKNILPDLSGNGNDLENKNFAYTVDSGYGDGYIQYDGIDDYSFSKEIYSNIDAHIHCVCSNYSELINNKTIWGSGKSSGIISRLYCDTFNKIILDSSTEKWLNANVYDDSDIPTDKLNNFSANIHPDLIILNLGTLQDNKIFFGKVRIYDVLMYNRYLTEEEIQHNYKASQQFNGITL